MSKEFQFWSKEPACCTSSSSAASQPFPTVAPWCTAPWVRWQCRCHHWCRWWKDNTARRRWWWRRWHTSTPLLCRALRRGRQRRTAARCATTATSARPAKCATPCAPISASTALSAPQTVSNLDIAACNAMWLAFLTSGHAWDVDVKHWDYYYYYLLGEGETFLKIRGNPSENVKITLCILCL